MRTWFVYDVEPIDWWYGWQTMPDALRALADGEDDTLQEFCHAFASAMQAATRAGYDGIPRDAIGYVSILPRHEYGGGMWMFAFKADNNGSTYIVSPYHLGWMSGGKQVTA